MAGGFTAFKDASFALFDVSVKLLLRAPNPLRKIARTLARWILLFLHALPRSHFRTVCNAYAKSLGRVSGNDHFSRFADGLIQMTAHVARIRAEGGDGAAAQLRIPEDLLARLDERKGRGAILVIPHATGSIPMMPGLAARYDILMLNKEPRDEARARGQRTFFANLGCEILDVRRTPPDRVARKILKALREGRFVIGTSDRIRGAPPKRRPVDKARDNVRVEVYGKAVGAIGWPARFAAKCGVPLIPLYAISKSDGIQLHGGAPVTATGSETTDTQAWMDGLLGIIEPEPEGWTFLFDKNWAAVFREAAAN